MATLVMPPELKPVAAATPEAAERVDDGGGPTAEQLGGWRRRSRRRHEALLGRGSGHSPSGRSSRRAHAANREALHTAARAPGSVPAGSHYRVRLRVRGI